MATALKLAKKTNLESLIEEAGNLQAEIAAKVNKYKSLRREIDSRMTIAEDQEELVIVAGDYKAKKYFQKRTRVIPEKLAEFDKDLFWRVCQVPTKAVQDLLDRRDFVDVTEVEQSVIADLKIQKVSGEE